MDAEKCEGTATTTADGIAKFATRLSAYYLDFLESDFKRSRPPRRSISTRQADGLLTSVALRKYPTLFVKVWETLQTPTGADNSPTGRLEIKRGTYKAQLSPTLRNLIDQHVAAVDPAAFARVRSATLAAAEKFRVGAVEDVDVYHERVRQALWDASDAEIVRPLLALLDAPLKKQAYSAIQSVYEIETDLIAALGEPVREPLATALNNYLVKGDVATVAEALDTFFVEADGRARLSEFFAHFAVADVFQELRDLLKTAQLGEHQRLYLYACDLRFANTLYPLFFIPLQPAVLGDGERIALEFDPNLFVNKRAVDFVLQEREASIARRFLSPVDERIRYVGADTPLSEDMARVLGNVRMALDTTPALDVSSTSLRESSAADVRLTNGLHFAVFDAGDESLLNDYEELLKLAHGDPIGVRKLFEGIVEGLIYKNPERLMSEIEGEWNGMPIADRLLPTAPTPLNEEQRKILLALKSPHCRYVAVQGPPGTGKSHCIVGVAFDAILSGRTTLILSDKEEALDVVEEKLHETLNSVRESDTEFPNPILRLGRSGSNFPRMVQTSSIQRIRQHYASVATREEELKRETEARLASMRERIRKTADGLGGVRLETLVAVTRDEQLLRARCPLALAAFGKLQAKEALDVLVDKLGAARTMLATNPAHWRANTVTGEAVLLALREDVTTHALAGFAGEAVLAAFPPMPAARGAAIEQAIGAITALRRPVIGYLFQTGKLQAIERKLTNELGMKAGKPLQERLPELARFVDYLAALGRASEESGVPADMRAVLEKLVAERVQKLDVPSGDPKGTLEGLLETRRLVEQQDGQALAELDGLKLPLGQQIDLLHRLTTWARDTLAARLAFQSVPQDDQSAATRQIERLLAIRMMHAMDGRFLTFVDGNYNTARQLGAVIRNRQQFPTDSFGHLRDAFPCIIASIREFAEFIPLAPASFDLVIIDEASQVSVAQAFPALLRASQVIVFGDARQFSNVKSLNASRSLNDAHRSELRNVFRQHMRPVPDLDAIIGLFDVRRSVLDFITPFANFEVMLRKHFRGPPELIDFCSETFYKRQLQAIKIRGKPLDETIRFEVLDNVSAPPRPNTNPAEIAFIQKELDDLLAQSEADEALPTVAIITPFREQVALASKTLQQSTNWNDYDQRLKLRIFTFDTCQGSEADVVYVSLVATKERDALNYIFPMVLTDADTDVEEKLKMQRLNVGLSRTRETIVFVASKPVAEFNGSIGLALRHFEKILTRADPGATDPTSPMEAKVLGWLQNCRFVRENEDVVELQTQFKLGDYLRQLDPTYRHPAYKVDFLLRYFGEDTTVNVVIEYDGLEEHFTKPNAVDAANFGAYMQPHDIERQIVLESYGYRFVRLNKFNLGDDPMTTISHMLYDVVAEAREEDAQAGVTGVADQIKRHVNGLQDRSEKICQRCKTVKPLADFRDATLKNGYGRVCISCKGTRTMSDATSRAWAPTKRRRRKRLRW